MIGTLITIGGVALIIFAVFWFAGGGAWLTIHQRTITVDQQVMFDSSGKNSHYLVHGDDGQIVELERQWWNWGSNIDNLRADVNKQVNKTITFECFGIRFDAWYWYSNCYKELNVK